MKSYQPLSLKKKLSLLLTHIDAALKDDFKKSPLPSEDTSSTILRGLAPEKKPAFEEDDAILLFPYLKNAIKESKEALSTDNAEEMGECLDMLITAVFSLALQNNHQFIKLFLNKDKAFFKEFTHFPKTMSVVGFLRDKSLLYCLIARNAVEILDLLEKEAGFTFTYENIKDAVDNQAEASVVYLLKMVKLTTEQTRLLAGWARRWGNIAIINALVPPTQDPYYYFEVILHQIKSKQLLQEDEFYFAISNAYRNSNADNVEALYQNFLHHIETTYPDSESLPQLKKEAEKAKKNFPLWASQLVRYRRLEDLYELKGMYGSENSIEKEVKFGLSNFKIINDICEKGFEFPRCQSNFDEYYPNCLPPKDFVSMKTLLSYLAKNREIECGQRIKMDAPDFNCINTFKMGTLGTPCGARYVHMVPFIEKIALEAKRRPAEDLKFEKDSDCYSNYQLYFNGTALSKVRISSPISIRPFWRHGEMNKDEKSCDRIWKEIEKIHKSIFEMNPKEIEDNPKTFYDQVVTFIWLMGNLTPTIRGTGRYVEQWLALAHHFHGLPIPVLKLGFQLDCINLTMPLELYKKLFLHFMEPSSLTPSAHRHMLSSKNDTHVEHFLPLIRRMDSPSSWVTTSLFAATQSAPNPQRGFAPGDEKGEYVQERLQDTLFSQARERFVQRLGQVGDPDVQRKGNQVIEHIDQLLENESRTRTTLT